MIQLSVHLYARLGLEKDSTGIGLRLKGDTKDLANWEGANCLARHRVELGNFWLQKHRIICFVSASTRLYGSRGLGLVYDFLYDTCVPSYLLHISLSMADNPQGISVHMNLIFSREDL